MARKNENILTLLMNVPWWVSVVLSALLYIILGLIIPSISFEKAIYQGMANGASKLAPLFAFVFLLPAPFAYLNSRRKKKLLDQQDSIESIKTLSWKEFEELVAEAYRRKGYRVLENLQAGADGGVDVRISKDNKSFLVQCKQWKTRKIGVSVIRQMYGLMTSEQAQGVIVICSGQFTNDAIGFAKGKPIELVGGAELLELIKDVQAGDKATTPEKSAEVKVEPNTETQDNLCPKCGSQLVIRTAKKGPNAGSEFYGCSSFPKCRYTSAA